MNVAPPFRAESSGLKPGSTPLLRNVDDRVPISRILGERHGVLLLDLLAEAGAGVVGAERIDQAVGRGVVDHAALEIVVIVYRPESQWRVGAALGDA